MYSQGSGRVSGDRVYNSGSGAVVVVVVTSVRSDRVNVDVVLGQEVKVVVVVVKDVRETVKVAVKTLRVVLEGVNLVGVCN